MFAWFRSRSAGGAGVIGGTPDAVAWLHGDFGRAPRLVGGGLVERGADTPAEFARRLRACGLPPRATTVLLPAEASQLLAIEAPRVADDELRAAARWRVKDLISERLEDLMIDVMPVGDGRERQLSQLFVAAARSDAIQARIELAGAAGLDVGVVDVIEAAQRNLQLALAAAEGLGGKATACLTRLGLKGTQALLTICAGGELYYARRLEGLRGGEAAGAATAAAAGAQTADALAFDADLESAAIVDYGAEPEAGSAGGDDSPLLIEVQRSLDVWERTGRELPLARLWVDLGEDTAAWLPRLSDTLGLQAAALSPEAVLPGFDQVARTPLLREKLLPLAGALLRQAPSTR